MSQIVFLTYLSRSGSTFLARLLDEYQDIGVTPEADIPDGMSHGSLKIRRATDITPYLDALYRDERFRSWQVDRSSLAMRLRESSFPVGLDAALRIILGEYFAGSAAKTYVYKRGNYISRIDKLLALCPGCKFVHILRDPRAIYESQKRTTDIRTGKPMAVNPVQCALQFNRVARILGRHKSNASVSTVRYEDLVRGPQKELAGLRRFLGSSDQKGPAGDEYFEKLNAAEKHIHRRIQKEPLLERLELWRDRLSLSEITAIERIAGRAMQRSGYDVDGRYSPSLVRGMSWLGYLLSYFGWHMPRRRLTNRLRSLRLAIGRPVVLVDSGDAPTGSSPADQKEKE